MDEKSSQGNLFFVKWVLLYIKIVVPELQTPLNYIITGRELVYIPE